MKTPFSKLPFSKSDERQYSANVVFDSSPKPRIVFAPLLSKAEGEQDSDYIIQACNNFPEAVDLLVNVIHPNTDHSKNRERIERFLLSLK